MIPLKEMYKETNIIRFYRNEKLFALPTLTSVWNFDRDELENNHFYIQWLFPLDTASAYNRFAPILTEYDIQIFKTDIKIRENVMKSLSVMLNFYGFTIKNNQISIAKDFVSKSHWLTKNNHNFKRITRILRFLNLIDMKDLACSFFNSLSIIYSANPTIIGEKTFEFWNNALI